MWLYIILFLIPTLAFFLKKERGNNTVKFLFFYISLLALFVGMSDMFGGYDRYIYSEIFDDIADTTTIDGDYIARGSFDFFAGEYGFTLLNIIISFITTNRYIFILLITIIIYWLLYLSLRKYTYNYPLALILFMGLWFYFTFTYLRQVLGATIVWLSIDYIIKRDLKRFFIVWLVAYSMHNSAIIFFPFYFVAARKYKTSFIITIMALALLMGITPIPDIMFNTYQSVSAIERANEYNSAGGFRIAYFIEAVFFLAMLLPYYKKIETQKYVVIFNMALIFCAILLFFIKSENGGRLSWYYMLGVISATTYVCTKLEKKASLSIAMIFVCLLLYIRIYNSWQIFLNLYPYKTFLTNGYRKGDYSWENYEYDHKYDQNKMYRTPFRVITK